MDGRKFTDMDRMVRASKESQIKNDVMDLLQLLGNVNRVEAMRMANHLIKFISECADLVSARPIHGNPRRKFCDSSFSFTEHYQQAIADAKGRAS